MAENNDLRTASAEVVGLQSCSDALAECAKFLFIASDRIYTTGTMHTSLHLKHT